jgi:hypothetical protein
MGGLRNRPNSGDAWVVEEGVDLSTPSQKRSEGGVDERDGRQPGYTGSCDGSLMAC